MDFSKVGGGQEDFLSLEERSGPFGLRASSGLWAGNILATVQLGPLRGWPI
jgi:hypothetical protein